MQATPTENSLAFRASHFPTLAEALDYAAQGKTGYNYYTGKGELRAVLPYSTLRERARTLARRFQGLGLERGARVALVAETNPDFLCFFFACQYAGFVPTPLPASIHLGNHGSYVTRLRNLLVSSRAAIAMAPAEFLPFLTEASEGLDLRFVGSPGDFEGLPESTSPLVPLGPEEVAYLQYTSGSTRFPRGVMITNRAVMNNLRDILEDGLKMRPDDRLFSWLPYYHDMGLVGFALAPVAAQRSVDYLSPRDFAMRPKLWLTLMSRNRSTVAFSPPFGYELSTRRLRGEEAESLDLRAWRVAGVGAEMIRADHLNRFAEALAPAGFDRKAFLASYGMAECSIAVSFSPLGEGFEVDCIDGEHLAEHQEALPFRGVPGNGSGRPKRFVLCGKPLRSIQVEVRDEEGRVLPDRRCGTLHVKGPCVMAGYFGDLESTRKVLSHDGWLNTGDIGYRIGEQVVVTGREKDLIIIKGRNIWPQDLEFLAEQQPEVRTGDASAFSVEGEEGEDTAVMVVQCRETDPARRLDLAERLQRLVREELAVHCFVELVPLHTLPRTSSGKLSRSGARKDFLARHGGRPSRPSDAVSLVPVLLGQQSV